MTRRPVSELCPDMTLRRDCSRHFVKSVSRAGKRSFIVTTDSGRFVYMAGDTVFAEFEA